jgi:quercetin dioxygenase-like cupin family protein
MQGALTGNLTAGLVRYVRRALEAADLDAATVCRFEEPLSRLHPVRPPRGDGRGLPVLRDWDRALALAPGEVRPLLAALGPALVWTRNPNYRSRPNPRFLANYGYGVIIGPADRRARPLIEDASSSMGLLMLGPDVVYPRHRHPAEEIYIPLAGTAWWQRGDAPWRRMPPGNAIHHPPHMPHATRTGGDPLVALYLWQGEIATHAKLDNARLENVTGGGSR